MKKNVTSPDRVVRLILAAVLVGCYAMGILTGSVGMVALVIAAVMAVTATFSFCPAYSILGALGLSGSCNKDGGCNGGSCGSKKDD